MNGRLFALSLVALALCYGPLLLERLRNRGHRFSPAFIVGTMHALLYGVGTIGALWRGDRVDPDGLRFECAYMLPVAIIALASLAVGHLLLLGRHPMAPHVAEDEELLDGLGRIFLFTAPAGVLYKILLPFFGIYWWGEDLTTEAPLHGMACLLRSLGLVALGVSAYLGSVESAPRRRWRAASLALLAVEFLYWVPSGQRAQLFIALLVHLAGRVFAGRLSLVRVAVLSTLVLLTAAPAMAFVRTRSADRVRRGPTAAYPLAVNVVTNTIRKREPYWLLDPVLARINEGLVVGRVVHWTPDRLPYAGGAGLDAVLYLHVPRLLWPDRPRLIDGSAVSREYGVGNPRAQAPIMLMGDLYRRFGVPGVAVGYLGLGALLAALARGLDWPGRTPFSLAACFVVMPELYTLTSASVLEVAPTVLRDQPLLWLGLLGMLRLPWPRPRQRPEGRAT